MLRRGSCGQWRSGGCCCGCCGCGGCCCSGGEVAQRPGWLLRQRGLLLRGRLRERGGELLLRRPGLLLLRQRGLLLQERGGDLLLR